MMRRAAAQLSLLLAMIASPASATWPPNGGADAAAALATRVLGPGAAALFEFTGLAPGACDAERGPCATISAGTKRGTVAIAGTTPVEMSYALAQYCQSELHMGFSWVRSGGFQTAGLPSSLPALAAPLKYQKLCAAGQGAACYTHYMNVVTGSYSAFNWNWTRWERECDWMALHGVNLVVAFNGQEYLWREVWRELGLSDHEIQTSFNGPASLSWSRTYEAAWENGGVWAEDGAFEYSLDEGFLFGQHALQGRIVSRQRQLGIGSVLPAFSGKVPGQMKRLFPTANMSGDGSPGPAWIAGTDPLFANISTMFLTKAIRDWGRTGFYEADGYFIGGPAPWMSDEAELSAAPHAAATELGEAASDHGGPGGAGSACAAAASIAEVRASAAADSASANVGCVYGSIVKHSYLFGYASDGGKMYSTMRAAKAACSKDIRCGGTLSRSCDQQSNGTSGCKLFQTRSGMSEEGCHAGVPCKNRLPHTMPEPSSLGWAEQQNAYPITNAQACGHHPSAGPPPSPHAADHGRTAFTHASAVWATMTDVDPDATWVYQAWPWMRSFITSAGPSGVPTQQSVDYMKNFTSAVPKGRLVMLDMRCECEPVYSRTESLFGTSFIFEVMDDFGGTNGIFGDLPNVAQRVAVVGSDKDATSLAGAGISMEGVDQNPVYYELVLDSLWEKPGGKRSIENVTGFIVDFGVRRCGKRVDKIEQAWAILANTTFRAGGGVGLGHAYCSNAQPSVTRREFWKGGYKTAGDIQGYTDALMRAWVLMTDSVEECGTAAVRFDIADVGREWLQSVRCPAAHDALAAAWSSNYTTHAAKAAAVGAAGAAVEQSLLEIDELLSSTPGFLMGEWIRDAMALGTTDAGRAQLAYNAKLQVTDWASYPPGEPWSHKADQPGNPANWTVFSGINDYAIKQWGGLIKDYQAVRFRMYVEQAVADAKAGNSSVCETCFVASFRARQQQWVHEPWNKTLLPAEPVGDTVAIARKLQAKARGIQ